MVRMFFTTSTWIYKNNPINKSMAITLRQESQAGATTKGSALSFAELDNNFIHFLTNGITVVGDDSTGKEITLGNSVKFNGGDNVTVTVDEDSSAQGATVVNIASAGISDVVSDTTPQLGGNLDVNSRTLVSTSNGNIELDPNGTGKVIAKITPSSLDTGFVLKDETDGVELRHLMYLFGAEVTGGSGDNKQMFTRAYDLSGTYTYPSGANTGDISWNTQYDFTQEEHALQVYGGNLTIEAFDHNGGSYATKSVNITQLGHYTEKVESLTDDSTADIHINCLSSGPVATFSLNDNKTFVFEQLPTGRSFTLIITNQGTHTATFQQSDSTAVKFPGGAPTVTSGAGKIDVVTVFNTGSEVIGNIAQDYS